MNQVQFPEGDAIVYSEGVFSNTYGKTAHGLVRFTRRYRVISVLDSTNAGKDAGDVLDGKPNGIPIYASLKEAMEAGRSQGARPAFLVMGMAPEGGTISAHARQTFLEGIRMGLNVDSGMHQFLSEDPEMAEAAAKAGVIIRDIRKPPPRDSLHFFSGKIEAVDSLKVALLGTDSAVGKRTTAWLLVDALEKAQISAEMVGTGQTAWLQGASFSLTLDALVNDFVSGEIEHAVWSAWNYKRPGVIVIEGQGSLMNPAYPGGFEILAAARPDVVILQHAPTRTEYDGFPGYPIHPLAQQIELIRILSGKPVAAITISHEDMKPEEITPVCRAIGQVTGLPAVDVLRDGAGELVEILHHFLNKDF